MSSLDQMAKEYKNRSDIIEKALRLFFRLQAHQLREGKDLEILNRKASALNVEAEDALSYQVKL